MRTHQLGFLAFPALLQQKQVAVTGKTAKMPILDQFAGSEAGKARKGSGCQEVKHDPEDISIQHGPKCCRRSSGKGKRVDANQSGEFVEIHAGHTEWREVRAESPVDYKICEGVDEKADDDHAGQLRERTGGGYFTRDLVGGVEAPEKSEAGQQQDNDYNRCPCD